MKAGHSPAQVPNRSTTGTPGHILRGGKTLAENPWYRVQMATHVGTGVKVCQAGEVWGPIWTLWTLGQGSARPLGDWPHSSYDPQGAQSRPRMLNPTQPSKVRTPICPPESIQLSGNRKLSFIARKTWEGVQRLTLSWQEGWS